jgi:hypothetical protein
MQDVRALFQGLPEQGYYLGKEAAGQDQHGPLYQVQILHPGLPLLGD